MHSCLINYTKKLNLKVKKKELSILLTSQSFKQKINIIFFVSTKAQLRVFQSLEGKTLYCWLQCKIMCWQSAALALIVYKNRVALNSLDVYKQTSLSVLFKSSFLCPSAHPVLTVSGVCVTAYGCVCVWRGFRGVPISLWLQWLV